MAVRTYYLQSLMNEPFGFDLEPAKKAFNADFSPGETVWQKRFSNWQTRAYDVGIGKLGYFLILTIRAVVCDALSLIKATFKLIFVYNDLPCLTNFVFCLWNITIADSALVLSVFTGIIVPSSRTFAENIHKGDVYLNLFPKVQTAKEAEDELQALEQQIQ